MEAVKPVCTHDGGCPQAAEPKYSHFKGGIDVSSAIPSSIRLSVELLSRNGLLVAGGRAVETSPIFVFRMTYYVYRGSGQACMYPRR